MKSGVNVSLTYLFILVVQFFLVRHNFLSYAPKNQLLQHRRDLSSKCKDLTSLQFKKQLEMKNGILEVKENTRNSHIHIINKVIKKTLTALGFSWSFILLGSTDTITVISLLETQNFQMGFKAINMVSSLIY